MKANKGYLAVDKGTGEVLWSGGFSNDSDAVRAAIEFLGEEKAFVISHVRLVPRAVVHEHVFVYDSSQPELSFVPNNAKEYGEASKVLKEAEV